VIRLFVSDARDSLVRFSHTWIRGSFLTDVIPWFVLHANQPSFRFSRTWFLVSFLTHVIPRFVSHAHYSSVHFSRTWFLGSFLTHVILRFVSHAHYSSVRFSRTTKNNTTIVVIQQNSRKLLMMDILVSETCRAHKKRNKIASDIKLVFYSSTITMMHGPVIIRCVLYFVDCRLQIVGHEQGTSKWERKQEILTKFMFGYLKEMDHMKVVLLDKNVLFRGFFEDFLSVSDCTVWNDGTVTWHRVVVDVDGTIRSLMWGKVPSLPGDTKKNHRKPQWSWPLFSHYNPRSSRDFLLTLWRLTTTILVVPHR